MHSISKLSSVLHTHTHGTHINTGSYLLQLAYLYYVVTYDVTNPLP